MTDPSPTPPPPDRDTDPEARRRELAAIHDIQFLIAAHRDVQEVLNTIVRAARDTFEAREATIRLLERDEEGTPTLRVAAWAGRPVTARRVWPLRDGTIDAEVMAGRVEAIEDLVADPRVRDPRGARERGLASLLAAPLRAGDQIIGGIRVYTAERRRFTDDEKAMVESLANQAAVAIENTRLFHELSDAHERLRASYEDLRSTQVELVKKERLAALGEMAALVAHEIRNPLTAVRGFAQRVQRKVADQPALVQSCQIIVDEVDRLNRVIVDVLDFARRLEPRLAESSLNQLVQDVLTLEGEVLSSRGIEIRCDCAPHLQPLTIDSAQIRQIVLNLVANARHAMAEHGGGVLILRTRPDDGGQALDVVDTGPGIPEEFRSKIFTPFFTSRLHGTGLGLTVAQRIIEDHGGSITFETEMGKGTTFTVHLPGQGQTDETEPG